MKQKEKWVYKSGKNKITSGGENFLRAGRWALRDICRQVLRIRAVVTCVGGGVGGRLGKGWHLLVPLAGKAYVLGSGEEWVLSKYVSGYFNYRWDSHLSHYVPTNMHVSPGGFCSKRHGCDLR